MINASWLGFETIPDFIDALEREHLLMSQIELGPHRHHRHYDVRT